MFLLIDNYDSFTYNVADAFRRQGQEVLVKKNDELNLTDVTEMKPRALVMSPGPGTPEEAGICLELVAALAGQIPILGICLGHQVIGRVFGADLGFSQRKVHGQVEKIKHAGDPLFAQVPRSFKATRYHSLALQRVEKTPLEVICYSADREVMGVRHTQYPIMGVQFHPESYGTTHGDQIMKNFTEHYVEGRH